MPEKCDICGVAALESEHFSEESLPFRRTKRYCPACRARLFRRAFAVLAILCLAVCCAGVVCALHQQVDLLDSGLVRCSLLIIFQWLMILPHELGHATAGRAFKFQQIRILVGSGTALFAFRLLGIPTLINLIPFGGITLSKPPSQVSRWQNIGFVGAGLLVNVTVAAIAWCFIPSGRLFNFHTSTVWRLLFWANVIVLGENLFPHHVQTPFGRLSSDGLQLWNALFRWNRTIYQRSTRRSWWAVGFGHLVKWVTVAVLALGVLFFIAVAFLPFSSQGMQPGLEIKIGLPLFMLALAFVAGWAAMRVAKHRILTVITPAPPAGSQSTLSLPPELYQLVLQALDYAKQNDFASAEKLIDQALTSLPNAEADGCWPLLQIRLSFIISQNDLARAEKVCLESVGLAVKIESKIRVLDGFASHLLYQSAAGSLASAERLARQALELAPGTLTLKGTLGGTLVEQGRYAEAEPFLQECLNRSAALHDQGISAFYLGSSRLSTGNRGEARRLIERAMVLYPEPWLLAKAQTRLKELAA
jgi:Tfp pilus assembly protein PilF